MSNSPLDDILKQQTRVRGGRLPSNFTYRVMERIRQQELVQRLRLARLRALWESSLVSLAALPLCAVLFYLTSAYLESSYSLALPGGWLLPALVVLASMFLLDTRLKLRAGDDRTPGS